MAEARGLAQSGRLEEANVLLDRAYKNARGDIREMREGETLTRTLNFSSAVEEYRYEHDRNDSHVMLLKFAIAEKTAAQQLQTADRIAAERSNELAGLGRGVRLRQANTQTQSKRSNGRPIPC